MCVNNLIWQTSPLIVHAPGLQHSREKDFIHMSSSPLLVTDNKKFGTEIPIKNYHPDLGLMATGNYAITDQ